MKGRNISQHIVQKEYNQLGKTVSLMLSMCRTIFVSDKTVVLDSGFFSTKVL